MALGEREDSMALKLKALDHVNVRTANLERMVEWYGRVLDMPTGPRPDSWWIFFRTYPG